MESQCQESSNIWNNSVYNNEIDCKKEEINKNYDVEHVIKSECRVVLKRLNIKVKNEGFEEVYHPDEYEHTNIIKKNKFLTPKNTINRSEMNTQINKDERSEEHNIQHNPKRTKRYKYKTNRKIFGFSIKNFNRIQWNIKKKYFKIMREFHSKENFTCNLCTQTFTNYKVLRAHLFFHIENKQFQCTICNRMFFWEFVLRRHKKEHNKIKQRKEQKTKTKRKRMFDLESSSKFLLEPVEQWKPFECDICGKRVMTLSRLEMHYKTHSSYICNICKREFKWECHLRSHLVIHSEDRPFKCDICNKGFKTKKGLKGHNETHSDECKYFCHICNRGFKTKKGFKTHYEAHGDEYKYSCDICGRSFKTKPCLANHKLVHNDRNYFCEICNTSFKTRRSLKSHVETHSDEYNYSCKICDRSFKTKSCLYVHKLVHTEERKHFCEICAKTFKHKSALVRHRVVQHKCR